MNLVAQPLARPLSRPHHRTWGLLAGLLLLLVLALLSLALLLWVPRIPQLKRLPAPLLAMTLATALQSLFQFQGVATIGSAFGGIPQACRRCSFQRSACRRSWT